MYKIYDINAKEIIQIIYKLNYVKNISIIWRK